jgi:hypothetical protein
MVELRGLMRQHFAHVEELTEERRQRANRGKSWVRTRENWPD